MWSHCEERTGHFFDEFSFTLLIESAFGCKEKMIEKPVYLLDGFLILHVFLQLTFDDLLYSIQASETELREGLEKIGAFHLQGNNL